MKEFWWILKLLKMLSSRNVQIESQWHERFHVLNLFPVPRGDDAAGREAAICWGLVAVRDVPGDVVDADAAAARRAVRRRRELRQRREGPRRLFEERSIWVASMPSLVCEIRNPEYILTCKHGVIFALVLLRTVVRPKTPFYSLAVHLFTGINIIIKLSG